MISLLFPALLLLGQTKSEPDQFPLAMQKSMELDDLDREVRRVHASAVMKRAQLTSSERLAKRGLVSQADLERETAEVRFQEAKEAELFAARAFKAYERGVRGLVIPPDDRRAYALLLEWVRKQVAMAQVDADYQVAQEKRTRQLFLRKAVSRGELEEAEVAAQTARAGVELGRSREAQIMMELAARTGERHVDPAQVHRLKTEYLKARIRYCEATAEGARRRVVLARDRARLGLLPASELEGFERAANDAEQALDAERKTLTRHESERPAPPRKRSA